MPKIIPVDYRKLVQVFEADGFDERTKLTKFNEEGLNEEHKLDE